MLLELFNLIAHQIDEVIRIVSQLVKKINIRLNQKIRNRYY